MGDWAQPTPVAIPAMPMAPPLSRQSSIERLRDGGSPGNFGNGPSPSSRDRILLDRANRNSATSIAPPAVPVMPAAPAPPPQPATLESDFERTIRLIEEANRNRGA